MYGMKSSSALSATGSTSLLSMSMHLWLLFALITVVFAVTAGVQLLRPARQHRP